MRYTEMPAEMRERVRRLAPKLCTKAVMYKGVKPEECMKCESPCGHGVALVSAVGLEPPKKERRYDLYPKANTQGVKGIRRTISAYKKGGCRK